MLLLVTVGVAKTAYSQTSVTLTLSNARPGERGFDGNIYRVGNQYGDVPTYFAYSGSASGRTAELFSPGENLNKAIADGQYVFIRPLATTTTVNNTLIRNFSGTIRGNNPFTVRDLSITTSGISPSSGSPNTAVTVTYRTPAPGGIFPVDTRFVAQILVNGTWQTLPNSTPQYITGNEELGFSIGGNRTITANIPSGLAAGTYSIRVVTTGLAQTVVGSTVNFTVSVPLTINTPTITTSPNSLGFYCPDSQIQVAFTVSGGTPGAGNVYKVQITDKDGNGAFDIPTTGSGSPLTATLNINNFLSDKFRIRVVSSNPSATSGFSNPITISRPSGPGKTGFGEFLETTLTYCQGQAIPPIAPTPTNGTSSTSFVWYNDGGQQIATGPTYQPTTGGTYQVQQTALGCNSVWSRYFVVINAAAPTLRLSVGNAPGTITLGEVVPIKVDFTGTGPWSFNYVDPTKGTQFFTLTTADNIRGNNYIYPTPNVAGTYVFDARSITNFRDASCNGTVSGSTTTQVISPITISAPTITTSPSSIGYFCPDSQIQVAFTVSGGTPGLGNVYKVQITDAAGNGAFDLPTSGSGSPLTVTLNINNQLSDKYKIRVVASNPGVSGGFSNQFLIHRPSGTGKTGFGEFSEITASYCQGQAIPRLEPTPTNGAIAGSFVWYNKDGQQLATGPTYQPTANGLYQVQQTVSGCNSIWSKYTVANNPKSPAPGDFTREYCKGESAPALTTNAANPVWYASNGTTRLSGAPTPDTNGSNTQYKLTQSTNGCESDPSTVSITIKPRPSAPGAVTPAPVCQYVQNAPSLSATPSANGTLRWYTQVTGNTGQTDQAPRPDTQTSTTLTFFASQIINGCESTDRTAINQTINPAPAKPAGSALLLCRLDLDKALSATALAGHRLNWYGQNASGGTASATAPIISAAETKTLSYYVSQTNEATSCESLRETLSVIVANKPNAPTVTASQFACLNTTPRQLTPNGNGMVWAATAGGGLTSPDIAPTPPTTTTTTYSYTVIQQFGNCKSDPSTITYTVRPLPAAPTAQTPQIACIGTALSLSALGTGLKWYASQTDAEAKTNARPQVSIPTNSASSQIWFVTQSDNNSSCESPPISVIARVLSQATARLVGDGTILGNDSTAIRIYMGGEGPWTLTFWDGQKFRTFTKTLENPLVQWVRPPASASVTLTQSYSLGSLSNECGPGILPTPYQISISPVTALEPTKIGFILLAYPNPVSSDLRVEWKAVNRKPVTVRILSAAGRVIWQAERLGTGLTQTEHISTGSWVGGLYFLQLLSDSTGITETKLMKN